MNDSPWMPPDPGSPRPETHEPVAVAPDAPLPPPPPVSPWARESEADAQPGDTQTTTIEPVPTGEPPRRRRSKVIVGAGVVAVLAVGAAGVFAVSRFSGRAEGGAGSPTDLGTALLTSIENEDVLGMTDLLVPGERDLFRQPMIDLVSELTRLEILAPDADLAKISGLDIALAATSVTSRATNVDDIVNVDMHAEATTTVDGKTIPVGDLVTDNMNPDDVADMRGTTETTTDDFDVTLTAVEQGDRWYFSLFHSLAENMRADVAPDSAIPVEGIGADGGDSPEAAVNLVLDRIEALDLAGVIRMLNPGEAAALQRYAPLFLDDAQAQLDDVPITLDITNRQFRVEGDGDQRTVFVDGLTLEGHIDGDGISDPLDFTVSFADSCAHAVIAEETFDICAGQSLGLNEADNYLADAPAVTAFVDALVDALADIEPIGLELRSTDGRWFFSPTATGIESTLAVLRALDRTELDQLIALAEPAGDEVFDVIFGGFGEYTEYDDSYDDFSSDEFSFDDSYDYSLGDVPTSIPEFSADDSYDISYDASSADDGRPDWNDCYDVADVAGATTCFQQYVDSGEIPESAVPLVLRFPECGYADVSWSGDLYSLPDAEFVAAAQAAQPCFLALVDSGQISSYELPREITHLECFEGRNWYNVYDDSQYDDRYYACIEQADAVSTAGSSTSG